MEQKKKSFEYTYSAAQQEEIEKIRKKYLPKEEDKMEKLRKLDKDVTRPGTICALMLGVIGCLLFGIGMCCTMVWADAYFVVGIVIGILGMVIMALALPMYHKITEKEKRRITPQILTLTEELLK